jgi:hypothetical protein
MNTSTLMVCHDGLGLWRFCGLVAGSSQTN